MTWTKDGANWKIGKKRKFSNMQYNIYLSFGKGFLIKVLVLWIFSYGSKTNKRRITGCPLVYPRNSLRFLY